LNGLPHWIQAMAPVWPTWHLGQLAIHDIGYPIRWSVAGHVAWLAAFSAVCLVLAALLFRRSSQKA
jgi:ABC-2 type transport system permease protein